MKKDKLVFVSDAIEQLKINPSTMYRWIKTGKLESRGGMVKPDGRRTEVLV